MLSFKKTGISRWVPEAFNHSQRRRNTLFPLENKCDLLFGRRASLQCIRIETHLYEPGLPLSSSRGKGSFLSRVEGLWKGTSILVSLSQQCWVMASSRWKTRGSGGRRLKECGPSGRRWAGLCLGGFWSGSGAERGSWVEHQSELE